MLLRDSIYQALRQAILTGEFRPGQELREQVLAERYGVSRSPIRDALLRLVQESLVTVLSRHGYRVKAPSISDIEEILNLRSLIEPACAAAAAKASDTAAQALERFRGFVTQNFKEIRYIDYNGSFHSAIAKSSGNERLAAVAFDLIQQFQLIVWTLPINSNHKSVRRDCAEHEAMIDAIQAHDAERAFQLAHEHTEGTRERVRTALRGRVGEPAPL